MPAEGYRGARDGADTERTIQLVGKIRSCSRIQKSSVTEMSAAVFQHSIGTRVAQKDRDGRTYYVKKLLGSVLVSGDLLLDTPEGAIKVREGSFRFDAEEDITALPASSGPVPSACEHLVKGAILYGEKFLSVGDIVELTATIRPSRDPDARYEVAPGHDAVIVDRTLEAMGIDVEGLRNRRSRMALYAIGAIFLFVIGGIVAMVTSMVW